MLERSHQRVLRRILCVGFAADQSHRQPPQPQRVTT
jgi:hypothetical protein